MEKLLFRNINNAKWFIGGLIGFNVVYWKAIGQTGVQTEVFGWDGNGGSMLKIITDLTDDEMARLKHARRMNWHWRGSRRMFDGKETIQPQELSDRGIAMEQEPYVEYIKRPPHDKYL